MGFSAAPSCSRYLTTVDLNVVRTEAMKYDSNLDQMITGVSRLVTNEMIHRALYRNAVKTKVKNFREDALQHRSVLTVAKKVQD